MNSARTVEAPTVWTREPGERSVFLAGGITDCPDWQSDVITGLVGVEDSHLALLNPRRADFPMNDPSAANAQIAWEHRHLRLADVILFWFPCETMCPIVLYELGAWSMTDKQLLVGVHPDYQRRADVEIQTGLVRPDVTVVSSLDALIRQLARV